VRRRTARRRERMRGLGCGGSRMQVEWNQI
jgi:hypothetical protein